MKFIKKLLATVISAALLLAFTGCFNMSADDLYKLPELSDEYVQLQREIDAVLATGAKYSAPTSGSYRQPVQFEDLDSDGVKEALVFFNVPGEDLPLKVEIFENDGENYKHATRIEGSGTDIKSIEYVDMDGDGIQELVVGWQIAPGVSMLGGYSLKDYQAVQLFGCDYTTYISCDLSGSGDDIAVIGSVSRENPTEATVYSLNDGEIVSCSAKLSAGVSAVSALKSGMLADGVRGIFVESTIDESSTVTDIITYKSGNISNVSLRSASGISQGTVRTYGITSADIDADGVVEVPNPVPVPGGTDAVNYWFVEWYAFDSSGYKMLKATTCHNYLDGWYLELPLHWADKVAVRRDISIASERVIVFSYVRTENETVDFLAIYSLSGDDREKKAHEGGRIVLAEKSSVIYAAEILTNPNTIPLPVSDESVRDGFHIIYSDLNT